MPKGLLVSCTKIVFWLIVVAACASSGRILFAQSKPEERSAKPIETTVSEVAANSERFNGKRVKLRASFESDGIEHSILEEPKCRLADTLNDTVPADPDCKRGLVPWVADEIENHLDIHALDVALARGRRGTIDKQIVATFTGRFICKPSCSAKAGRILEIEQIDELAVKMNESPMLSHPKPPSPKPN
jgi:hypothetical protein